MSSSDSDFLGYEDQYGVNQDSFPGKNDVKDGLVRYGVRRKLEEIIECQKSKTCKVDKETEMAQRKEMANNQTYKMNVDGTEENETDKLNEASGNENRKNSKKEPKTNKYTIRDNWVKNTTDTIFFIERANQDDKPVHTMEMAKILHNIGIKNYKELKFAGQGRYRISFNRPKDAEDLINSRLLSDEFKFKTYVPTMVKESVGIVRDVPPTLTDDEILNNIQTGGKKKVTKVERIKRMKDGNLIPTYTIKIYVAGQELPENVTIYGVPAMVQAYIFPIRMCNKCWRYGHRQKSCRSNQERCENCELEHEKQTCMNPTNCYHCKQTHKVTDKNCPERIRQDKIRYVMANEKLTFIEASNKFPKPHQIQNRLDSLSEFPPMTGSDRNNTRPMTRSQSSSTGTISKTGNHLKQPQEKQTEISTIINKISAIQKSILKHADKSKNNKDTIDTDILLINISDQIKSIIDSEVTKGQASQSGTAWAVSGI